MTSLMEHQNLFRILHNNGKNAYEANTNDVSMAYDSLIGEIGITKANQELTSLNEYRKKLGTEVCIFNVIG